MSKLDFNSYYIATVRHLPDGDKQNLIIKLTWSDRCDFSYRVLNYSGDNKEVDYFYSEDEHFKIVEKIEDDGTTLLFRNEDYIVNQYYFVRLHHSPEKNLHTAIIRIIDKFPDGDLLYEVVSYTFKVKKLKSKTFLFELIKFLQNAWL